MGRALEFLIPGDIRSATGGYVYDRRMVAELRALGWTVTVHTLDASFPRPTAAALAHADRVLESLPSQTWVLIDGLALSAMPSVLRAHAARLALLALIHMPSGADVQNDPLRVRDAQQAERAALQCVRHVFVTGQSSLDALLGYGVAAERISMIEPGTDEVSLARRPTADGSAAHRATAHGPAAPGPADDIVRMLCVATVQPLKGHELLIDALAPLVSLPWQLTCVGSLTRSPETVARLRAQLKQHDLSDRVTLIDEVEPAVLAEHFRRSDLFVLATRFESYCMAVAEALAHGLPVVSTRSGAIPQLVGTQAGLLVAPGSVEALRAALAAVLSQADLRSGLAEGALIARRRLPRWSEAGARFSQILERLQVAIASRC